MIDPDILIETFNLERAVVRGDNLMASCPFADIYHDSGKDSHPSFGINLETQNWNCYVCGEVGGKGKTIKELAIKLSIPLPTELLEIRKKATKVRPREELFFQNYLIEIYSRNPDLAYEYLKERGVSYSAIEEMRVGAHKVLNELYFIDIDVNGNLRGVTARSDRFESRYKFELGDKQHALFGMDAPHKEVFLVEGPVDALKLKSWGFNGVATLGDRITDKKALRISPYARTIYLVPDNDTAGSRWERQALRVFGGNVKLFLIKVSTYEDVGNSNYTEEMFLEDYRNKIPVFKKPTRKRVRKKNG